MNRTITLAVAILFALTALRSATAQPDAPLPTTLPPAEVDPSPTWTQRDWIMAPLYGSLAGAGAGLGLGYLGYQVDGHCLDAFSDCVPTVTALGAYSGLVVGSSLAVNMYGDGRGFRGSFRASLLGAVIGNVASGLPTALAVEVLGDDLGVPVALVSLVALPAIGATIAYRISDRINSPDVPTSGALVDVRGGSARLSLPAVAFGTNASTGLSIFAPILGGSFE